MYQIFHNPRCSKSREALAKLRSLNKEVEVIEYLKYPPSADQIKILLMKLNMSAEQLVRKSEEVYKQKLKGLNLNEQEWIQVLVENPVLIERPIVIKGNKAVVARPCEAIEAIL